MAMNTVSVFPAKNAATAVPICFYDNAGNFLAGWTGNATNSIYIDGVLYTPGDAYAAPVEDGATGMGYINLTAAQMNGSMIQVKASVTNTNAQPTVVSIYTTDYTFHASSGGAQMAWNQSPQRLEQYFLQMFAALMANASNTGQLETVNIPGTSSQLFTRNYTDSDNTATRGDFG